jgi:hypothetical protein
MLESGYDTGVRYVRGRDGNTWKTDGTVQGRCARGMRRSGIQERGQNHATHRPSNTGRTQVRDSVATVRNCRTCDDRSSRVSESLGRKGTGRDGHVGTRGIPGTVGRSGTGRTVTGKHGTAVGRTSLGRQRVGQDGGREPRSSMATRRPSGRAGHRSQVPDPTCCDTGAVRPTHVAVRGMDCWNGDRSVTAYVITSRPHLFTLWEPSNPRRGLGTRKRVASGVGVSVSGL